MNAFPVYSVYDDPDFWLDMRSRVYQHAYQAPRMDDNSESWLGWLFWNENEMAWREYARRLQSLRWREWCAANHQVD